MADSENIKMQKLLFTYERNYFLSFLDENDAVHSGYYSSSSVDIYNLVKSCFEEVGGADTILTCSCGEPQCAGIYDFCSWIEENEICWKVNKDFIRFEKNQYIEQVKNTIDFLLKVDSEKLSEDNMYIYGMLMNKEIITRLRWALTNYSEVLKQISDKEKHFDDFFVV